MIRPIFDDYKGSKKVRTCTLMVTHACNLNCTYCYEHFKSDKYMTIEMARSIIDKEIAEVESLGKFESIQFDFMGGEPLMNFPLIKDIVEYVERNPPKIPYIFFATTNATLLTPEMKEWFSEHKESIWLGASCDGTEKMQSTNRGASKQQIDFGFFKRTWPLQSLHMTISRESLPNLAAGVLSMQRDMGFRVEAALAQGIDWTKDDAVLFRQQLQQLGEVYLADDGIPPINLLGVTLAIEKTGEGIVPPQPKFCGTGTHMVTYDLDGKMYGCHLLTPVVLGNAQAELRIFDWGDKDLFNDKRCDRCVLRKYCPTCAGFNYKYRGSLGKRDMRGCLMSLARAISACEFQIRLIANRRNELPEEDAIKAKQAIEAYEILTKIDFPNAMEPFIA